MPSHFDGSAEEKRALSLFIAITRASESVQRRALETAPLPDDLTISQFAVLEALFHLGSMCQADIARKIMKTKGNISLVVENLIKRDYVTRTRDENDRRRMMLELTPTGRRLIADYFPSVAQGFVAAMAALDASEQTALTRLAKKLGHGDVYAGSTLGEK